MDLSRMARSFGYDDDGQHVVLPFPLGESRGAKHPVAAGGKLTVSPTGHVAGMVLDADDRSAHGTFAAERLAVWSMDDEQLETLARVARDALAMRRAFRAAR